MDSRINIIIPVYNRENLIKACLDSVCNQTYANWVATIVDDGSTDSSLDICDSYEKKDPRFKVFHQENQGIAGARNTGLEKALEDQETEYIMFLDSDDILEPVAMERALHTMLKNQADMVQWQPYDFDTDEKDPWNIEGNDYRYDDSFQVENYKFDASNHCEIEIGSKGALWTLLDTKGLGADKRFHLLWNNCRCVWTKCCKRELYENVRCPIGKSYEDDFIVDDLFMNAKKIIFMNDSLTNYRKHPNNSIKGMKLKDRLDKTECERNRFVHAKSFNDNELTKLAGHNVLISSINSYMESVDASQRNKEVLKLLRSTIKGSVKLLSKTDKIVYLGFSIVPGIMLPIYRKYRSTKG